MDIKEIRKDFPIFNEDIVYLDSGATSQRPKQVIEKINEFYERALAVWMETFLQRNKWTP